MRCAAEAVMPGHLDVTAEPLTGGSSAFVAALNLSAANGEHRRVVFRQHTNRAPKGHTDLVASKEFHLTHKLADQGLKVAQPLALHGDDPADGPWLVSEWIDGTTHVPDEDVDTALAQMADYLARLHQINSDHLDAPGVTGIEDPIEALPSYLPDDDNGRAIQRAIDIGIRRRPNASVLLHGDFWPGNVMFKNGTLVAVLDWEDAAWGDPLVDLACARVELSCAYGVEASARFTTRYLALAHDLHQNDLSLWDVYVSATALSSMHLWGLSASEEAKRRRTTNQFLGAAIDRLGSLLDQ